MCCRFSPTVGDDGMMVCALGLSVFATELSCLCGQPLPKAREACGVCGSRGAWRRILHQRAALPALRLGISFLGLSSPLTDLSEKEFAAYEWHVVRRRASCWEGGWEGERVACIDYSYAVA